MNYNESDATLRRIPIYLENASGNPVPAVVLTGSEVQVSLSGAAFVNGGGSVVEVGSGYYYYQSTQAETATDSFLMLKVVDASLTALPYVYTVDIGERIEIGETVAAARRLPIYLVNASGNPVPGLVLTGSEVQIAGNGFGFVNAVNVTAVEIGSGAYYYECATSEVADDGVSVLKVVDPAARPYIYAWDVVPASAPDGECGGYFGGYFGMCDDEVADGGAAETTPVETPITVGSITATDHITTALKRLPEYAKVKASG